MNRYHEERNFLLYIAGSGVSRRKIPGTLHESDYAAVYTPPKNTPIPIVGPCLIWRYGLNTGGYGALWLNGKKRTAHSVAYEMTRGEFLLEESVLHLCHRRCCIQPAHLYAGSAKENREDTDLRLTEKGRWRAPSLAFSKYGPLMKDGMRHYWDEPALTQPSFLPPEHNKCIYTIPAGKIKLCQICFKPEPHLLSELGAIDFPGKEAEYRDLVRGGLDECCKGRGPGDDPLEFVPAYCRLVVSHSVEQMGAAFSDFVATQIGATINYQRSKDDPPLSSLLRKAI